MPSAFTFIQHSPITQAHKFIHGKCLTRGYYLFYLDGQVMVTRAQVFGRYHLKINAVRPSLRDTQMTTIDATKRI